MLGNSERECPVKREFAISEGQRIPPPDKQEEVMRGVRLTL